MKLLYILALCLAFLTLVSALSERDDNSRRGRNRRYKNKSRPGRFNKKYAYWKSASSSVSTTTSTRSKWGATTTATNTATKTSSSTKVVTTTTTSTKKPITTTTTTSKSAAPTSPASSSGTTFKGEGTYYTVGLGSCGQVNSSSEMVAALNAVQMKNGSNSNKNPQCGTKIKVTNPANNKSVTVTLVDTCPPCASGDVDLSPAAFAAIAEMKLGRIPIEWQFV